jgi:hypothetical protein
VLPRKSTVHPEGPLAHAIEILTQRGCHEEVSEIKRLLAERLQFREQLAAALEELSRLKS